MTIPTNLARVPNTLASQIVMNALQRTQRGLLNIEIQLATGRAVNRASDNPLATSIISVLDDVIERRDQHLRNLSNADAVLNNVDAALAEVRAAGFDLVLSGIGHFASGKAPRVLWVGVEKNEPLAYLQGRVEAACARGGLDSERRNFSPHITLARLRNPPASRLGAFLSTHFPEAVPPGTSARF